MLLIMVSSEEGEERRDRKLKNRKRGILSNTLSFFIANFTISTPTNFNLAQVGGPASKGLICHKFPSGSYFLPLGAAGNIGKLAQFILNWAVPYKSWEVPLTLSILTLSFPAR
jgi:hypothetical protein